MRKKKGNLTGKQILVYKQYVGCTSRPLRISISDHFHGASYTTDKTLSNVSIHFKYRYVHAGNVKSFTFCGLDGVKRSPHGSDIHHKLLEREVWWIFNLQTRIPVGLNFQYNVDLFLK